MANENPTKIAGALRRVFQSDGALSDGVAGTLAGTADPGDLCVRIDAGNIGLYQNTNTKASPTWGQISAGGVTLDGAYDYGGAGAGKAVTVDSGAIALTNNAANNNGILTLEKSPVGAQSGDVLTITVGAQATGAAVVIANSGSGNDVTGSGSTWTITKAGLGSFTNVALLEGTAPAGTVVYVARDNDGDAYINALVGKSVIARVAGTAVATFAGAAITLAQATTISTGGLTVAAGGATVTGNSTITGNLEVTGSLTFGGNWTVAATLTVDELVLDTDGAAPAGTNCYAVRDNAGDLTVNAVTGKQFLVAINNTDEYTFSATILDFNGNAADNVGYIILNAATAPDVTEVYMVNDNTGDLTLNALTGKTVNLAINGVDILRASVNGLEVVSTYNIKFLGNNGLLDSNGNEAILIEAVAGATTYLNVKGGNAAAVTLECLGAADLGFVIQNDQDEEILILTPVATAVNELTVFNAVTTARPIIRVTGEADIGVEIQNLAGEIEFATVSTNAPVNWLSVSNANTGNPVILLNPGEDDIGFSIQAKNAEEILILAATAAAVNEVTITSAAANGEPTIAATGDDADIDLALAGKGTGGVVISVGSLYGSIASGGNLLLSSTRHATKGYVGIATGEEGFKIGGTADRAGTVGDNALHIFNGAAAPAGPLANGITLYSEGGECKVLDAAGNSTTLSPHTDDGDYVIHSFSAAKNETVTIHLEKMLKALAQTPALSRFVEVKAGHSKRPVWA